MIMSSSARRLATLLSERGVNERRINEVLDSGFILRNWVDPFSQRRWVTVSDSMYGNKQPSSTLDIDNFIGYLDGGKTFEKLPPLPEFLVRNTSEIIEILSEPRRAFYRQEGSFWLRGQSRQHYLRRIVPNPLRQLGNGEELSIVPGAYRQAEAVYSFGIPIIETRSFNDLLHRLEPSNPSVFLDGQLAFDLMRVEQHYATQTRGLDVTPDIDSALFFATNKFVLGLDGIAYYEPIETGAHQGVIYCFRFRDPPVKESQYLIRDFDLFKTYPPERIIRQQCALPLFSDYERNIAVTDIDCILRLHEDFVWERTKTAEYMFPCTTEDHFYKQLLDLRPEFPDELKNVVEYAWA